MQFCFFFWCPSGVDKKKPYVDPLRKRKLKVSLNPFAKYKTNNILKNNKWNAKYLNTAVRKSTKRKISGRSRLPKVRWAFPHFFESW